MIDIVNLEHMNHILCMIIIPQAFLMFPQIYNMASYGGWVNAAIRMLQVNHAFCFHGFDQFEDVWSQHNLYE